MNMHPSAGLYARIERLESELASAKETIERLKGDVEHKALKSLTCLEAKLAATIIKASPRLLSKPALMDAVYGGYDEPEIKIINVLICNIRRKLPDLSIETVWGRGYQILEVPEKYK